MTTRLPFLRDLPRRAAAPWLLLGASAWLAGCGQTPPYAAPAQEVPAQFKQQAAAQAQGL